MKTAAFKDKFEKRGKWQGNLDIDAFFGSEDTTLPQQRQPLTSTAIYVPPRLVSDQMINIFFQEWAPLFPIVHRSSFLKTYNNYVSNPEKLEDKHAIAQIYLIFDIVAQSSEVRNYRNLHDLRLTSSSVDPGRRSQIGACLAFSARIGEAREELGDSAVLSTCSDILFLEF